MALVVDFDGTLIPYESEDLIRLKLRIPAPSNHIAINQTPKQIEKIALWETAELTLEDLEFDISLVETLKILKNHSHTLVVATGSPRSQVSLVVKGLRLFDGVYGTTSDCNLTGSEKASFLEKKFGRKNFDYIGNSDGDIPVWEAARLGVHMQNSTSPLLVPPSNVIMIHRPTELRLPT